MTDAGDGTDGILHGVANLNDPAAGAALTSKGHVDAQDSQEGLRPTQAASERAGIFGPVGRVTRYPISPASGTRMQKVGGGPGPGAAP
jgi:hypothetical protein